jgi:hypothetical protein
MLKFCEVFSVTKNPYHARPLPYIIGSKEWNEDDRVGLGTEDEIKGKRVIVNKLKTTQSRKQLTDD